jgi:hypothetical protein
MPLVPDRDEDYTCRERIDVLFLQKGGLLILVERPFSKKTHSES